MPEFTPRDLPTLLIKDMLELSLQDLLEPSSKDLSQPPIKDAPKLEKHLPHTKVLSVTQCCAPDYVNFTSVSHKFPKKGFL